MRGIVMTVVGMLVAAPASAEAPLWEVDHEASRIGFVGRQNGSEVNGRFERFEATIRFAPDQLATSSLRVEIVTASAVIAEGGEREEILKGSAWFNVEDFPRAIFTAGEFEATDQGYRAFGMLEIKGIAGEVPVDFDVDIEGDRAVAEGTAELMRTVYGIGPEGALFGIEVAPEVDIRFHLEATRAE